MINDCVREYIDETVEKAVIFNNPSFDDSIIGTSDNHIVYDYGLMIEELCYDNDMTFEEAIDFLERNTLRSIPYTGDNYPIIVYPVHGI